MTKFEPQSREKPTTVSRDNIVLGVRMDVSEHLSKVAKDRGITKQDLIRQMIQHCLGEMGIKTETDVSAAPSRRKYERRPKTPKTN